MSLKVNSAKDLEILRRSAPQNDRANSAPFL